jgi:O-antigen/teichoic acid export membrane protein
MLNGMGLAIMGQGDRLMVAAILGLPFLGLYAVIILTAIVPTLGLSKILTPILFAGLNNAHVEMGEYDARMEFFSRMTPVIAACFSLCLIAFLKSIFPLVFGARFLVSDVSVLLVALIAFLRVVRSEPFTSLLLHTQNTGKLAVANLSTLTGLIVATWLAIIYQSIEAVLTGGLVGEAFGLCVVIYLTRHLFRVSIFDYVIMVCGMLVCVVTAGLLVLFTEFGVAFINRAAITGAIFVLVLVVAWARLYEPYRRAYLANSSI